MGAVLEELEAPGHDARVEDRGRQVARAEGDADADAAAAVVGARGESVVRGGGGRGRREVRDVYVVRDDVRDGVSSFELRDDGRSWFVADVGFGEGVAEKEEGSPEDGVQEGG